MRLANRSVIALSAGTLLVLSVVVAGLQQAGTARPTATLHAAQPREAALATSSLSGGVSSEQATLDDVNRRLAAAADAAETQRWELVSSFLKAVHIRPAPSAPAPAPAPAALPPAPSGGPGQRALAAAEAELGKPYSYGGAGPGSFDCSGLTMFAWRAAGVSLPHSASDQSASTTHVPLSSLQPGDLLFFGSSGSIGHVGMYVSPGRMIEAEDSGTVVSINPIRSDLVGASRP
ncbi:MAG TPA: C40 family peptidase [Acidimicrobiales bacterium]|nr:C40 family peptidase [Acidimicrobiales bacterium]